MFIIYRWVKKATQLIIEKHRVKYLNARTVKDPDNIVKIEQINDRKRDK